MQAAMDELQTIWQRLKSRVDELATERQHYLHFFEEAADPCFVTDGRGRILEANGAAVDLLDRRRLYLSGKPLQVFVAAEERRAFRARVRSLTVPECWRATMAVAGRQFQVEVSARPIGSPSRGICWRMKAP